MCYLTFQSIKINKNELTKQIFLDFSLYLTAAEVLVLIFLTGMFCVFKKVFMVVGSGIIAFIFASKRANKRNNKF